MKYAGALGQQVQIVRPLAGAGIEIRFSCVPTKCFSIVRPLAGAGIEMISTSLTVSISTFAPSRGRELKFCLLFFGLSDGEFAPSRGRELKLPFFRDCILYHYVRPLAGAGIEIGAL